MPDFVSQMTATFIAMSPAIQLRILITLKNFVLHFLFYKNKSLTVYTSNSEMKSFLLIIIILLLLVAIFSTGGRTQSLENIDIMFHILSFATTSGFTVSNYSNWPTFIITIVFLSSFIGACAGSAGGGMKVIRFTIALKSIKKQLLKVIHPKAEITIKVNDKKVDDMTIETILSFIILYLSLIHISEPTRPERIWYGVFCL